MRLKPKKIYTPNKVKKFDTELEITGEKFSEEIEKDKFLTMLALVPMFQGTHGLGVDDLRFYNDKLTGKYHPIVRDLKIGAWPKHVAGLERSFLSHFSFFNQLRFNSIEGYYGLKNPIPGYEGHQVGVWDVHPVIKNILQNNENRIELEKKILNVLDSNLLSSFKNRYSNFANYIKNDLEEKFNNYPRSYDLINDIGNPKDKNSQWGGILNNEDSFYLGSVFKSFLKNRTPVIKVYNSGIIKYLIDFHFIFFLILNLKTVSSIIKNVLGPLYNINDEFLDSSF